MRRAWLNAALGLGVLFVLSSGFVVASGCKQGEGDLCQIDRDCSGNLVCNPGTGRCQAPGAGVPDAGPDAAPPADAATFDAEVPDAEVPDAEVPDADR